MAKIESQMFSPELLNEVRDRFLYVNWDPYSGERIYLEASGGGLRLKSVLDTMCRELALPDELFRYNPASDHVVELYDQGIEDVKIFLGAKSGVIVPANSATHTLFRAVNAITAHVPGNNVVTTQLEHPASSSAAKYYAEVTGKEFRVADISKGTSSVRMETILEKIDKDTNLLVFQHASNQTGAVNDAKKITEEARKIKPELYVVVDAVQYAPHGPIDVEDIGADAYAFGPYKAYCVKGIGFAHYSDRLARLPHENLIMKPETNWVLGSPPHAMLAAWSAVVEYYGWLGRRFTDSEDRREQVVAAKHAINGHMVALLERVLHGSDQVEGLMDMDHVSVCGVDEELVNRMCILLFQLDGMDSSTAMGHYNNRYGVRLAARVPDSYSAHTLEGLGWPDGVRLSAGHYNTPEEIDRFLRATRELKG
jgi:selenocysteine lyase/cysteine desulfurase